MIKKKLQMAGIAIAATLSLCPLTAVPAADTVVEQSSIMTACGLFDINSNAGLLTSVQRVQIIQKRLDNALIAATDLTPKAVKVVVVNRNPVVTLDENLIATADGNSATRNSMTQMALAEKWAHSLRVCLADSASIQKYISMLTGKFPATASTAGVLTRDEIAVINPETLLPLTLLTELSAEDSVVGEPIEAVLSTDVPLRPFFDTYLPAGTLALGEIVSARKYTINSFAGKDAISINFYKLRTPNGEEIPIQGHFLGGLNKWRMIHARPITALSCMNGPANSVGMFADTMAHVSASKGYIVGAWKGLPIDELAMENNPRLVFSRDSEVVVKAGEPMLLKLTASTAIAIAGRRQLVSVLSQTH